MSNEPTSGAAADAAKTRLFISYSRSDKAFTHQLVRALEDAGYGVQFDQSEGAIAADEEWWDRLQEMIAAAEAMVFIVSPASASSKVCDEEIAYARALGKRVIPVRLERIDWDQTPPRLRALNIKLSFENASENSVRFYESLQALTSVLDMDVAWHREAARLMTLAVRWDSGGRSEMRLLAAGAVAEANEWAARRPARAEPPGEPLIAFLAASAAKATADRERLLTITGRAFVQPAEQALAEGRHDAALRLAAAGMILGEDLDSRLVPQRVQCAVRAGGRERLQCVLRGHEDGVSSATFSPDGSRIVTAVGKTARLLDAASGAEITVLRGHENDVWSATFSPDGSRIVTASEDMTARVWDAASGGEVAVLRGHDNRVWSATFSPDGSRIVTAGGKTVRLWDAASGGEIAVLHGAGVRSAAFSPDGSRIVTASEDMTARVWDAASGGEIAVLRGHESYVQSAVFSPDGSRIVTASRDMTGRVWAAATGGEIAALRGHDDRVESAAFSADGSRIVTVSGATARVWDA
ncbi:MAG: toll/interleukin-1 receptor domain-containing protein, partial [Hyphomonadaceae bacterium]